MNNKLNRTRNELQLTRETGSQECETGVQECETGVQECGETGKKDQVSCKITESKVSESGGTRTHAAQSVQTSPSKKNTQHEKHNEYKTTKHYSARMLGVNRKLVRICTQKCMQQNKAGHSRRQVRPAATRNFHCWVHVRQPSVSFNLS